MPDGIPLAELSKLLKQIDDIFTKSPLLIRDKEDILNFKRLDVGSTWLTFACYAEDIVKYLAALVVGAFSINKLYLDNKKTKLDIDRLQADQKAKDEITTALDCKYKEELRSHTNSIALNLNVQLEPEDLSRQAKFLQDLAELFEKGVKIFPSLNNPEEIQNAFPKEEEYAQLAGEIQRLTDGEPEKPAENPPEDEENPLTPA